MKYIEIQILSTDTEVINHYKKLETKESTDSGIDIVFPNDMTITNTCLIPLGIKCQLVSSSVHGYFLMPRSSIWKTPLRQCNSIGLIDFGYRGELCAPVDLHNNTEYTIKKGERLFQLVLPNAQPFKIKIVNELTETERGEGGFGSTGK